MKYTAIIQARVGSSRFPKKILQEINGMSLLEIHLRRVMMSQQIDQIIIATTFEPESFRIIEVAKKLGVNFFQGSENDVLDRYYQAANTVKIDNIIRLTSDCPLLDPSLLDQIIKFHKEKQVDYCSNVLEETFPDGQDIEVFTFDALKKSWKDAKLSSEREHVTLYIRNHSSFKKSDFLFTVASYTQEKNWSDLRMTVDENADFEVIKKLVEKLGIRASMEEYAECLLMNKDITAYNSHIIRNEGLIKSIKNDNEF